MFLLHLIFWWGMDHQKLVVPTNEKPIYHNAEGTLTSAPGNSGETTCPHTRHVDPTDWHENDQCGKVTKSWPHKWPPSSFFLYRIVAFQLAHVSHFKKIIKNKNFIRPIAMRPLYWLAASFDIPFSSLFPANPVKPTTLKYNPTGEIYELLLLCLWGIFSPVVVLFFFCWNGFV